MSKPVAVIVPSLCPDDTVKGYETRCLKQLAENTDPSLYNLMLMEGTRSYPEKVNHAARQTVSDWICILSNDVFVSPDWLEILIEVHRETERCGVLSPMEPSGDNRLLPHLTRDDHWWACVLMKRSLFEFMGGLDETLPLVYHDQNFSIRIKRDLRLDTCRTGAVVVEHVGSATRSRVGTMDDEWERTEMVKRYGAAELHEWVRLHKCA
jgi:GT2 family glycosyltransferase